jgi:hypothetical protein
MLVGPVGFTMVVVDDVAVLTMVEEVDDVVPILVVETELIEVELVGRDVADTELIEAVETVETVDGETDEMLVADDTTTLDDTAPPTGIESAPGVYFVRS